MSRLPPAIARWEESLAGLSADVARAVGPLLPMLDDLVGRLDRYGGESGEPDGYDGTTNRGELGRLLVEEWLLAQELPEEFVRRAAERELSFFRMARRAETPRGRVVAVVDTGPEQLGVGRLVQLAALVVLHRRAADAGSELALVLVGARRPAARFVSGATGPPRGRRGHRTRVCADRRRSQRALVGAARMAQCALGPYANRGRGRCGVRRR